MLVALLVCGTLLVVGSGALVARWLREPEACWDRACAAALLAFAMTVCIVVALGWITAITTIWVRVASASIGVAAWFVAGAEARALCRSDARSAGRVLLRALGGGSFAASAWLGVIAAGIAAWAVLLLAPWAWDALGYHLPVVFDAMQTHRLREVPTGVVYINAYPHAADLFVLWWRCVLGNNTWIELAQLPFGLAAVAAIAAMAVRAGAAAPRALGLGLAFLALPAVALQLAANYVDVIYAAVLLLGAYFAIDADRPARVFVAGLAIALLLATKPSAPPAAALLALATLRGARRARVSRASLGLAAILVVAGCGTYLRNAWVHGNPVWPVRVGIAGHSLPGLHPSAQFFNLGVPEPYRSYGWLHRLLASWFAWPERFVYDMRIGGLGPLFAFVLLPVALGSFLVGKRSTRGVGVLGLVVACTLATPGAFWARYTLALPGALLAYVIGTSESWRAMHRHALHALVALSVAAGLWLALPGFTDGGPSLWELSREPGATRAAAVSVDGHAREWTRARAEIAASEAFAYDPTFGLPGLLWQDDGDGRVEYLANVPLDAESLVRWVAVHRVRMIALGDGPGDSGALARMRPDRFEPVFHCPVDTCTVYRVRRP